MNSLMQTFETKTFIGALIVVIAYISESMHELFVILAIFMVLDYITGILCGMIKNEGFSYKKGITGAIKKLMYLVLIIITVMLEFLIEYLLKNSSFNMEVGNSITIAMYIYLIGTEGLSIIQNLIILGIPVPPFMTRLFGLIKDEGGNLTKK